MRRLIECVPNISEGRNLEKIKIIINHINNLDKVKILDVDSGDDTNRTVITIIGEPKFVAEAAFQTIKISSEIIDMRQHSGTHPRIGSTDVCPFIPISGVSDEECITISKDVAKRVGNELSIPVYLYEKSARNKYRSKLTDIRRGEYEGLKNKLNDNLWLPDYGPKEMNIKSGATVIGCRDFLIAYNINLNTRDKRLATDIAFELREAGRSKRIPNPKSKNKLDGDILRYSDGRPKKEAGKFKDVKAIGWYVDKFKRAQISINFNNYKVSSIQEVYDEACKLAHERGVRVTGSELVGLIPLDAIYSAGVYFLKKQNRSVGIPDEDIIECAVQSLGLNDVSQFDPNKKIIEYVLENNQQNALGILNLNFLNEISRNSPVPGGGSVSALVGSLGAALTSMVAALTHETKGMLESKPLMNEIGQEAQSLKDKLAKLIEEDAIAFSLLMNACRLPSTNDKEKLIKKNELNRTTRYAIEVPLETADNCLSVLKLTENIINKCNINSISDLGVGAEVALAGLRGAVFNAMINLKTIDDKSYVSKVNKNIDNLIKSGESCRDRVFNVLISKLKG